MSKYGDVGDPAINEKTGQPQGPCAAGRTSIRVGNEEVTLVAGQPTEVSDAIAARLKNSNHFKFVVEKVAPAAPKDEAIVLSDDEQSEPSEQSDEGEKAKKPSKSKK